MISLVEHGQLYMRISLAEAAVDRMEAANNLAYEHLATEKEALLDLQHELMDVEKEIFDGELAQGLSTLGAHNKLRARAEVARSFAVKRAILESERPG